MLYLEDYLEMIEHLPGELRDRFTEMRELDLTVHNSVDSIEKKCRTIFLHCKRGELDEQAAEVEFNNLRQEFYKALEDADEKVNIATQVHELVERYLRRLDSELFKFKCELEADNNGITEILERRSLELENNSSVSTALLDILNSKENQNFISSNINTHGYSSILTLPSTTSNKDVRYRIPKVEKRRDNNAVPPSSVPEKRANMSNSNLTPNASPASAVRPITPGIASHVSAMNVSASGGSVVTTPNNVAAANAAAVPYNLQQLGGSASTAIAAAASQAIVATQQMQHGRRTASLKASYEAIHGAGGGPTEFWISRDIANAANVAAQNSTQHVLAGADKKHKKKLNSSINNSGLGAAITNNVTISSGISIASSSSSLSVDSVDMLPTNSAAAVAAVCSGALGVSANNNTTLNSLGFSGLGANPSTITHAAVAVSSSSRGGSASSSSSSVLTAPSANLTINENGLVVEHTIDGDWTYDPNEPRYCTCNQVSYGDMVACDNDACPYEWFHYPCVGITQPPKGKWYCPKCTVIMRRRGSRKN